MRSVRRSVIILSSLLGLVTLLASTTAVAQDAWQQNAGNCDEVLQHPEFYDIDEVRQCARRWESYRSDLSDLSEGDAQQYARGFSRLYYEGSSSDQRLADGALSRMGQSRLSEGGSFMPDNRLTEFLAGNRRPIEVETVSRRNRSRAGDRNGDGMDEYNDGDYQAAAREFRRALESDPFHVLAKFNLVCQLALLGQTDEAIQHLDELSRWVSGRAQEQVDHARVDPDLISLRDDPRFRYITGYMRVQLLNGAGEAGEERVAEIHEALSQQMDVASYGTDRHVRARPTVWFSRGLEDRASEVAQIMASDVSIRVIDWDSEFDIVVVWGEPAVADTTTLSRPVVQGFLRGHDATDPEEAIEDIDEAAEDIQDVVEDPAGEVEDFEEWVPGG